MIVTERSRLEDLCRRLAKEPFFTIDTEFLRDKTYYPQLCLVQVAAPDGDPVAIDPLADLDLEPLYGLVADSRVLKVFHAARQDLEIFFNVTGAVPHPIFDTQVAAMVCGFGESIGYNNLVHDICGERLDKGAQFTDWSRRPLSSKQISYALDDVTYLRDVYRHLSGMLDKEGRASWLEQEMDVLTSASTYENDPENAWRRIKIRTEKPKVLSVLREIAAWREREAQHRDVPRSRVMRDDAIADLAVHAPKTVEELMHIRGMPKDMAHGRLGRQILDAVNKGLAVPPAQMPRPDVRRRFPSDLVPVLEMLKMLLRIQCSEHNVAPKLVAGSEDLEALALDDSPDIHAMKGWRYEVFGREALALKAGKITLGLEKGRIVKREA